jgi:hypothetical protein
VAAAWIKPYPNKSVSAEQIRACLPLKIGVESMKQPDDLQAFE